MAIENGDRKWRSKMAIGEEGRSKIVVVVVSHLSSHFLSSPLYSFSLALRLSYDFLYL